MQSFVVKKTGQWEFPFYQTHGGSSEFVRCLQRGSLSGPGNLPTPRVDKLPLSTEELEAHPSKNLKIKIILTFSYLH